MRKGLLVRFLVPLLDLHDKLFVLPLISVIIRKFVTSPTEERHFLNYVQGNLVAYVYYLSID